MMPARIKMNRGEGLQKKMMPARIKMKRGEGLPKEDDASSGAICFRCRYRAILYHAKEEGGALFRAAPKESAPPHRRTIPRR